MQWSNFLNIYEFHTDPSVYHNLSVTSAVPAWEHLANI
jgi:hypothetical protein